MRLKSTRVRLNPPEGEPQGSLEGSGTPLHVVGFGDSCIQGYGADRVEQSITARVAQAVRDSSGRAINWKVAAKFGVTVERARTQLLPEAELNAADAILIVLGVNDAVRGVSFGKYRQDLRDLLLAIRERSAAPIVFSEFPPIRELSAFPEPLRTTVALHCRVLDLESQSELANHSRAYYAPVSFPIDTVHVSRDGFHASAVGYECWASQMLSRLQQAETAWAEPVQTRRSAPNVLEKNPSLGTELTS